MLPKFAHKCSLKNLKISILLIWLLFINIKFYNMAMWVPNETNYGLKNEITEIILKKL